jgi:hypothetical protein
MKLKRPWGYALGILLCLSVPFSLYPAEGMLPLSEIHKLDLRVLGFEIGHGELYNPKGVSLIDGIINLRGCTASFVSPQGLILTNYHCAFGAIQRLTDKENDYMLHGFLASDRSKELEAGGYTVRLIEFYRDVSKDVLKVVKKNMTYAQRTRAIEKEIKKIVVDTENKYKGRRAEVAEMFLGKTYVLFVYTYLKDVRLVYAPPRSVGEYGGEEDNWMWPRHTGDFAFMRAYTAPDGSPAEYSEKNVPFRPKKYLQVAPEGVKENDFVFILGYPGRTYRHRTSHFFAFEEEVRKPYVVKLYRWAIDVLEAASKEDRSVEIKLSSNLRGLWNTMKAYMGQLKAMKNLGLTARKRKADEALQAFIDADPKRKQKYGNLLVRIGELFKEKREDAEFDFIVDYLLSSRRANSLLSYAFKIYEASIERKKKDTERESAYMDRNFSRTRRYMIMGLRNYHQASAKILIKGLLMHAARLQGKYKIPAIENIIKGRKGMDAGKTLDAFIDHAYQVTKLKDKDVVTKLFEASTAELEQMDDPLMRLAIDLYPTHKKKMEKEKRQKGILDNLLSKWVTVKQAFEGKEFIPDANSTLRLTYGRIKGYSPADAIYYTPFTSLGGVVEKHTGKNPFIATDKLVHLHKARDFGSYAHPGLKDVPVNILYSTDTTGGNSGSPVLNAKGQLIGLNFDRVYEATINDFGWDETYSRSIGVDIRYILWFLEKYGSAGHLIKEMSNK